MTELMNDFTAELDLLEAGLDLDQENNQTSNLPSKHTPETTLLVVDNGYFEYTREERTKGQKHFLSDFYEFHRSSYDLQSHLVERDLIGKLQIVLFHPFAVHSLYSCTSSTEDVEAKSYAIRSPFPTFHLLREQDVLSVVKSGLYTNPEFIPSKNATHLELKSKENKGFIESAWMNSFV
eukprot:CAMPEP_0184008604 /NCGR_PEP_ID=MMETSP0954-20121128/2074_1 /TAXON_ID=627963 /ORGANISM="Aplanochytrium sp, Strain PBS07" /LENGTH=178 /DNA_ID=CAMNT_0026287749 /DNA_START=798 /DNA_END=1334 /DNA_ORIENTATION=-